MAKLHATLELSYDYGHPGNRPSESYQLKKITEELNKILDRAADRGEEKTALAGWYLTGIKVQ